MKLKIFSYPSVLTFLLGAQKNRLIETVLMSTHIICFGWCLTADPGVDPGPVPYFRGD